MEEDNKKIIKVFLLGMFTMAVLASCLYLGMIFFADKKAAVNTNIKNNSTTSFETQSAAENSNLIKTEIDQAEKNYKPMNVLTDGNYSIKKGEIKWIDPKDIGDFGLTTKENYLGEGGSPGQLKYLKVGDIVDGKYAGSEIIIISSMLSEGPQIIPNFIRILVEGKNKKVIFLTKYIDGYDDYYKNFIETTFSYGDAEKFAGGEISINELDYPEKIKDEKGNIFVLDKYSGSFFDQSRLKKAFVHSQLGQIWMTDPARAADENIEKSSLNENSNVDIFKQGGFYAKLADGTVAAYSMGINFYQGKDDDRYGKLAITWNNGKINDVEYEKNPSGCGSGAYVYDKTMDINLAAETVPIGKTSKSDVVYGYKDFNNPDVKEYYENSYWVEAGQTKKSLEEFLTINPMIFWVDSYGRTLEFYRSDIISPAECGKPVVYLYPEKPMNVSVKVNPGNGLSFTDPEYRDGWNVFADTKSNLKNISDGKTYPYLFWEGAGKTPYEIPKQGFVVAEENLDSFFDEKLSEFGLINKEINDFKEFWVPKILENEKPYYFVTFISKRYIDKLAPLIVEPKPDTVIRILMDYKGLDQYENVPGFNIKTPERKGFTVVEWGGFLK